MLQVNTLAVSLHIDHTTVESWGLTARSLYIMLANLLYVVNARHTVLDVS